MLNINFMIFSVKIKANRCHNSVWMFTLVYKSKIFCQNKRTKNIWKCQDFSFILLKGLQCVSQNFWQTVSEVRFHVKSWTSKRSFEFHDEFRWEVAKFVASDVHVIRCSWFGNTTTSEFKQSENISQPNGLFYDVNFWDVNYLRYRRTPHHRRMARQHLVYIGNVNTISRTRQLNILFFSRYF